MSLEKKYNSIDQSKLKPAVRDILKKMKDKSENFTNSDINKKVEPALDKLLMRLQKELPEAIKKATKTPSKPKAKPKAKAKAKPKTKSTKETFTQKASKLMKQEGISWAEAKNKLSKQLKDEKDKVEKDIKSDNKQALNELDKLIKSTEFKKDLGKFPKKSSGEERELTSDISADGKRQALPRGKRKSKNGKTYYEYRDNRSDVNSLPAPKGQYRYKGKTPPYLEAGGTLPTPFGQAGLVGETGTMNEVDLFAMGGGLPQGVHQYYAQTYNPAYPTPHGYAKGGTVDLRNKETLKRLKIDLKESQKYLDSIPKNIDKDDQISKTFGGNKYTGAVNTKEQLKENIEQLKSDIKNLTYANGGDIPVGFHKMPNGEIMADSEHLAEGGETIDGFTLNTIKGVANKPTNVDIDKLDINYAEGGVILTYNKPNKAINLTNVKSKEDFDNLIKHYKENASSIHYINESDIKRNKHWLVVVKYKDNDDFIVNNFSNKKEAKELFNHYQDMETVDFVNLFDLDGTTYAEGGEIDLFEDYEKQPKELAEIVETYQERYADGDMDYESTKEFLGKVNAIGYTFDSGLDNEPFGLRKMAKGGKTKRSKHSIMQDRRRVSSEPWEVAYQKRKAKMEAGGTLPTPFGQAGLVGETGTMNEVDLFAMGGGLPQGVHQYYAQTYNPAYPTPHGYAKGGMTDVERQSMIDMGYSEEQIKEVEDNPRRGGRFAKGGEIQMSEVYNVNGKDYLFHTPLQNDKGTYTGWDAYEVVYDIKDGEKHLNYTKTKKGKSKYFPNGVKRTEAEDYFAKGGKTDGDTLGDFKKRLLELGDKEFVEYKEKQLKNRQDLYYAFQDRLKDVHKQTIVVKDDLPFAKGGKIGFDGLAKKVAKKYEGKPVKADFQSEYGKTYSKAEAMEVGKKVAGKVYQQQQSMAKGGLTDSKYIPSFEIYEVVTKDGKVYENDYSAMEFLSGAYISDKVVTKPEDKDGSQMTLFDKGGKIPKGAIYIKRRDIDFITVGEDEDDKEKVSGKNLFNGFWIDPIKQKTLIAEATKDGRLGKSKAKVGDKVKLIKGAGSETVFRNFPNGEYEVKKVKKGNKVVPEGFYEIENKDGNKSQLATSRFAIPMAKGGKTQGYNDKLNESLGNTKGKRSTKEQNYKDRRNESEAMEKKGGKRKYASVKTMDKGNRSKRRTPMSLAKEIRKEGEDWQQAVKRASAILKKEYADK